MLELPRIIPSLVIWNFDIQEGGLTQKKLQAKEGQLDLDSMYDFQSNLGI